jgi:hypothetical protein
MPIRDVAKKRHIQVLHHTGTTTPLQPGAVGQCDYPAGMALSIRVER